MGRRGRQRRRRDLARRKKAEAATAQQAPQAPATGMGQVPPNEDRGTFLEDLAPDQPGAAQDCHMIAHAARRGYPMSERFRLRAVQVLERLVTQCEEPRYALAAVSAGIKMDEFNLKAEQFELAKEMATGQHDQDDPLDCEVIDVTTREDARPFLSGRPVRARIESTAGHGQDQYAREAYQTAAGIDPSLESYDSEPAEWTAEGDEEDHKEPRGELAGGPEQDGLSLSTGPAAATKVHPPAFTEPSPGFPGVAGGGGGGAGEATAAPPMDPQPPANGNGHANANGNGNGHKTPGGIFGMMQRRAQGKNGSNGNGNEKH